MNQEYALKDLLRILSKSEILTIREKYCPRSPGNENNKTNLTYAVAKSIENSNNTQKALNYMLSQNMTTSSSKRVKTQIEEICEEITFYGEANNSTSNETREDRFQAELLQKFNDFLNSESYEIEPEKRYSSRNYDIDSNRRIDIRLRSNSKQHLIDLKTNGDFHGSLKQLRDFCEIAEDENGKMFVLYIAETEDKMPSNNDEVRNAKETLEEEYSNVEVIPKGPDELEYTVN